MQEPLKKGNEEPEVIPDVIEENPAEQGETSKNNNPEKIYTVEDVNRIVNERLKRIRAKYKDYDELKEKAAKSDQKEMQFIDQIAQAKEAEEKAVSELEILKNEMAIKSMKESVSERTGVPSELIFGDTEEECFASAKALIDFARSYHKYPVLKDSGEVRVTSKKTTAELFAEAMM